MKKDRPQNRAFPLKCDLLCTNYERIPDGFKAACKPAV